MKSGYEKINAFRLNMTDQKLTLFCLPIMEKKNNTRIPLQSLIIILGTADMYVHKSWFVSEAKVNLVRVFYLASLKFTITAEVNRPGEPFFKVIPLLFLEMWIL